MLCTSRAKGKSKGKGTQKPANHVKDQDLEGRMQQLLVKHGVLPAEKDKTYAETVKGGKDDDNMGVVESLSATAAPIAHVDPTWPMMNPQQLAKEMISDLRTKIAEQERRMAQSLETEQKATVALEEAKAELVQAESRNSSAPAESMDITNASSSFVRALILNGLPEQISQALTVKTNGLLALVQVELQKLTNEAVHAPPLVAPGTPSVVAAQHVPEQQAQAPKKGHEHQETQLDETEAFGKH